jgi:hypothetical protein
MELGVSESGDGMASDKGKGTASARLRDAMSRLVSSHPVRVAPGGWPAGPPSPVPTRDANAIQG